MIPLSNSFILPLDIEGAFDAIPHHLLKHKMKSYGFGANVIDIISSYLSNRKLKVKVNNSVSNWSDEGIINSGVPQGSILAPSYAPSFFYFTFMI
jgi:hypothetical protein